MEQKKITFFEKLKSGLSRTRDSVFSGLFHSEERVNDEFFDELEEGMILADMGMETTQRLLEALRERVKLERITERAAAREALIRLVADAVRSKTPFLADQGPAVAALSPTPVSDGGGYGALIGPPERVKGERTEVT